MSNDTVTFAEDLGLQIVYAKSELPKNFTLAINIEKDRINFSLERHDGAKVTKVWHPDSPTDMLDQIPGLISLAKKEYENT